jgi:PPOX class probable F420-dependent enzyme
MAKARTGRIRLSTLADTYPLLGRPLPAVLTTVFPDGRLQSTIVWFACDRQHLLVSTMREFAKTRNLRSRPVATLLVVNPEDTTDWVEVRANVSLEAEGAQEVLDDIGHRYTGLRPYFGQVVPADLAATEHPVTCRLAPVAVSRPPVVPPLDRPVELSASRTQPPPPRLPTPVGCGRETVLPSDHLDLLDAPLVAALATRLPSGFPQTQPVWYARDGNDILVSTTLERRKGRNMLADPRATLLIVDPVDSSRWIEIRADVDLSTIDAEQQLDALTRTYTRHTHYYGEIYPLDQRNLETRVIARLHPRAVHCDAIHR